MLQVNKLFYMVLKLYRFFRSEKGLYKAFRKALHSEGGSVLFYLSDFIRLRMDFTYFFVDAFSWQDTNDYQYWVAVHERWVKFSGLSEV